MPDPAAVLTAGPVPAYRDPRFSVVIAAYTLDRWDDLQRAVASLRAQEPAPHEIIVAVDGNPELLERVRATLPDVIAVENDRHAGAGGARNAGSAVATGEVLAFIDDDVHVAPGWLAALHELFADPTVLGAGGPIRPDWATARPAWFPPEFDWVVGCTFRGSPQEAATVRNLIAANMTMRRDRFEQLGGFRTGFGKVGTRSAPEETDLCIRAGQRWPDAQWRFEPTAAVWHAVPAGRTEPRYFLRRCWLEGTGKAALAAHVGSDAGTSTERDYVARTLPSGVLGGVGEALRTRTVAPLGRSAMIVLGLAFTVAGYVIGTAQERWAAR
ncbi:glycosyltransferase [Conexibacter sp. W3-3-2]|uniref:glycosyltransferase family 2 protein n=1 Tax=Conexibacter sp. W3-3-2 TaxID=2675227 RepID=UPI0012B9ADC5|nr:glycosyltransferase family 2 protein [Conexibacter sp. W3-3-2]MTD43047.1 glycosyltransferase [Conexibacter sp. W3-3-2]